MSDTNKSERRKSERFQTLNLLSFQEKSETGEILSQGIAKTLDLSETGALIELPNKFSHLECVEFELALEDEILKMGVAVIDQVPTNSNSYKIRIQFKGLRPAQWHKIARFIRSLQ